MDQSLLVFVTVAEKRSFTRTAEELHMTQPAVSQYVQTLEKTTGAKLLDRSNKYVRLTKAGEIVYHHAKEILGLYTRMDALVADLMQVASGPISIGSSFTFGEYVLPHVIADMLAEYPLIEPTIMIGNTADIGGALLAHQLDIGIIEGDYSHDKLRVTPFAEDVMDLIVSANHPFAAAAPDFSVSLADMAPETWIVRERGSGTREAADRWFESFGFVPRNMMSFGSTQLIKESVEAGLGVTLLSRLSVRKELQLGTLRAVNAAGTPVKRKFSLVTHASPYHTKATQVFIACLQNGHWGRLS
ncbi:LysR family transcriptional regulator [Paenibacillus mendelii]|uniref:LysR family transcriptional regulator n=1 Tax=Paenibacillus mendelii TaxID=206163 RepID=A0ABV6JJQ5_9BACL|nr:LysR family transcriptional regulator [Paenibacillus mendelii]MCQ6559081.1 LysR family transcriptional regulator [Paenibacillus mendelii]